MFTEAALAHGRATEAGDSRLANKQSDALEALRKEFERRGAEGQEALLTLMRHNEAWVQLWASAYGLLCVPQHAEPVLVKLSLAPGLCGFTAETTLEEWRKGSLRFED